MLSTFVAAVLAFASTLSDVQVIELAEAVRGLMREPAPLDSEHAGYLESALPKIVSFAKASEQVKQEVVERMATLAPDAVPGARRLSAQESALVIQISDSTEDAPQCTQPCSCYACGQSVATNYGSGSCAPASSTCSAEEKTATTSGCYTKCATGCDCATLTCEAAMPPRDDATYECSSAYICQDAEYKGSPSVVCTADNACREAKFYDNSSVTCSYDSACYMASFKDISSATCSALFACKLASFERSCKAACSYESACKGTAFSGFSSATCSAYTSCTAAAFADSSKATCSYDSACTEAAFSGSSSATCSSYGSCDGATFSDCACCIGDYCPSNAPICGVPPPSPSALQPPVGCPPSPSELEPETQQLVEVAVHDGVIL